MSEEQGQEEEKEKEEQKTVKVSHLLGRRGDVKGSIDKAAAQVAGAALGAGCMQERPAPIPEQIQKQIEHNQELYTTLSRSLLELHNDMRDFRKKQENTDRMIFSLQQGVNKVSADFSHRIATLENSLKQLIESWNNAVGAKEAEVDQNAVNKEGEENTSSNA